MPNIFLKLFGNYKYGRFYKSSKSVIAKINKLEREYANLGDFEIRQKTEEFKNRIQKGESPDKILPEAFALVKNAARRLCGKSFDVLGHPETWNMVHYDVQLLGGIALHQNMVAEIATGEGKTLVATLPAYLNALAGKGCHVATVNEYLAMRDAQWMGNLYRFLGLSCACVYANQSAEEKKAAYNSDITYGTASEFGFDYLRDNSMAFDVSEQVQRGFYFCLVDEADSVLIDEARTPLIISGPDEREETNIYVQLRPHIEALAKLQRTFCNNLALEAKAEIESGDTPSRETLEKLWLVKKGMPRNRTLRQLVESGSLGKTLSAFDKEMAAGYNKIVAYKLKEKLYYTIDEKEQQSDLTEIGRNTLAPHDAKAFVMPDIAQELKAIEADSALDARAKAELKLEAQNRFATTSERIHALSQLLRAYALYERDIEYIVRDGKVEIIDKNTGRVMEGRRWSEGLHQAVEAKERVEIENENITYATVSLQNYFRMYEKLAGMTGTAESEAAEFADIYKLKVMEIPTNTPCIRIDFPDLIFKTRREKYKAVGDRVKEAHDKGQPVLVGTSSVEDSELLSRFLKMLSVAHTILNAKNDALEAEIVAKAGQKDAVTISTNMAGRGTDIKLAHGVAELGGLLVIGTEHHESRRVDRQLQGRCARQGDPGQSVFMVSLEDDLMRLHADMSFLGKIIRTKHQEGFAFSHPVFSRIITRAQKFVEGENFTIRKRLLQFDDSANKQREVIYGMRNAILNDTDNSKRLTEIVEAKLADFAAASFGSNTSAPSAEELERFFEYASSLFPLSVDTSDLKSLKPFETVEKCTEEIMGFNSQKREIEGEENSARLDKILLLNSIDTNWRDHIRRMDELHNAIFLRGYGQKDPLNEYKIEAFDAFRELLEEINTDICRNMFKYASGADKMNELVERIRNAYAKRRAKII